MPVVNNDNKKSLTPKGFAKELEIVLGCAKQWGAAADDTEDLGAGISGPVDWDAVIALAGRHGLTGFVYAGLTAHGKDLVPEKALDRLKKIYFHNSARNLYLGATLLKILNLFQQHHIAAIGFKGPVQSEILYQDIGIRTFADLDILVKKQQAVAARDLLTARGFVWDAAVSGSRVEQYLEYENFFQLADAAGAVNIDLHWEITGRYNLVPVYYPEDKDLVSATLLGKEIQTLAPEEMLIHLCIHAASHCWDRLELICSVGRLASGGQVSRWDRVLVRARALKCWRMVLLGLLLARKCVDVRLDPVVQSAIAQNPGLEKLAEDIMEKIRAREAGFSESLSWRFSLLHLRVRDSLPDRIRYLVRLLTMPTVKEWTLYPLPPRLTPLYRIIRPLRLGWQGLTLLSHCFYDK